MKTEPSLARATCPNTVTGRLTTTSAARLLRLLLLLALPGAVQAQFDCTTNNGTITITKYTGPGGAVAIPNTTNGFPVTRIGTNAFYNCTSLTSVTIPNTVTSIGFAAFRGCTGLTTVTIPNTVTSIGLAAFEQCTSLTSVTIGEGVTRSGGWAFDQCTRLTSVTIPNSMTNIGEYDFAWCSSLTNVTIGNSVTSIGEGAFESCTSLTGVYFKGNAPSGGSGAFYYDYNVTVYYLPGTTGWGTTYGDLPTALWWLPNPLILTIGPSFGIQTNGFGFIISWATNIPVVVEASTTLTNPTWSPISTITLTGGSAYFSDPTWTNYPSSFYRIRSL